MGSARESIAADTFSAGRPSVHMQAPPVPHSLAATSAAPSMAAVADPGSPPSLDSSDGASSPKQQTNLFINYLPPDLDDAGLRHSFSPFGEIENCKVMLDLNTGESRCFGFVKFKTRDQANRALQAMNGQKLGNKTLVVKFADTTNDSIGTPSNNIYVKNLSPTMSLQELEGLFSAYGKIQECKVLKGTPAIRTLRSDADRTPHRCLH